jgi:hypothetical protein
MVDMEVESRFDFLEEDNEGPKDVENNGYPA